MYTFFSDAKSQTTEEKEKQSNRKSNQDKIPNGNKRTTEISTAKVQGRHSFQSIQLQ